MLGCVAVGMGAALLPKSVLGTFPERGRLGVHRLPARLRRLRAELLWRAGTRSPNLEALLDALGTTR